MEEKKYSKSIKKKIVALLLYALLGLFSIILILTFLLRQTFVQNYLAGKLTTTLSEMTDTRVGVRSLKIDIIRGIEVNGLYVEDTLDQPFLRIGKLKARPELLELLTGHLKFRSATLDTLDFRLIVNPGEKEYSFIQFINKLTKYDTSHVTGAPFKLSIKRVDLRNIHFILNNENIHNHMGLHTIDFDNLNIRHGEIHAQDFHLVGDSLHFFVDRMSAKEKSGFEIKSFRSEVTIDPKHFIFKNTFLKTNHSSLHVDYEMQGHSWDSYKYYIDSVNMTARFWPSKLVLSDLGYFSGVMFTMPDTLKILGGRAKGSVRDIRGKDLDIKYGKSTRFYGDVSFIGLPDFYVAHIKADFKNLVVSASDLQSFALPGDSTSHIVLPDIVRRFKQLNIKGNFKGSYGNFVSELQVNPMNHGSLNLGISLKSQNNRIIRLGLNMQALDFPLDEVFHTDSLLGNTDFNGTVFFDKSLADTASTHIHFDLKRIFFNSYDYHNISFSGRLAMDSLRGALKIDDPHLRLLLHGYAVLKKTPKFHLQLALGRADFDTLNWWKGKDFHLTTKAKIVFQGLDPSTLTAHAQLSQTRLRFGKQVYPIAHISIDKYNDPKKGRVLNVFSDLFKLKLFGNYDLPALGSSVAGLINHYFPAFEAPNSKKFLTSKNININLVLTKPAIIGEQFIKGLSISPNSSFRAKLNFQNHTVSADGYSGIIKYRGIDFSGNSLKAQTKAGALHVMYQTRHLILKDSTKNNKSVFGMDSLVAKMNLKHDSLNFGLFWNNRGSRYKNSGDIEGLYLKNQASQQLKINRSLVYVNNTLWRIYPKNRLVYDNQGWHFEHFVINSGLSKVSFLGMVPSKAGDSLEVVFHHWDLSNLDLLWQYMGFNLDGIMNGYVNISNTGNSISRVANLTLNGLSLNKSGLGTAYILSTWDDVNRSAFIKSQIIRKGPVGIKKVFGMDGFYFPYRNTNQLDLNLNFDGIKLKGVSSFLKEYISHLQGEATGKIKLSGTIRAPELTGALTLDSVALVVNYLNTKYSFRHNTFVFNKDNVDFGKFILYDTLGNHAVVQGKLLHHNFQGATLDVKLSTKRLLFFNTNRRMNQSYYGTAIGAGNIDITGPLNNILMNINVQSADGTSVVLPLDYSSEISDKDFIIFQKPVKDTLPTKKLETVLNIPETRKSQYQININMGIRPSAHLKIYLPSDIGSVELQGEGALKLQLNSSGNVNLAGDYIVDKGSFDFSLANLIRKHFELVKGGRISWSGNPYKATVNIKGLYKLKADISTLGVVIDSTAGFKNRVNVDCYVVMSHELFNPQISFQIKFPDLDPDLQRLIYAQLDTTNQALINQQMISLLVLRTFSMSNMNNATLSSSYYRILSNQLSGLLSRISKDFDVGVNYKPGDKISKEEFDVALSTQLFNDRLLVNGSFGMSYNRQRSSASNLVGDVDIGYKITKDGRWMLKAFNHSNVNSWYYYNNYDKISPYTQGVGIVYRKAFNNIGELFSKKRKVKKKPKGKLNQAQKKE